jgi:hypothetical protein
MAITRDYMMKIVADCSGLMSVVDNSITITAEKVACAKTFADRYTDLLKYEGFVFSNHAWDEPDRGRALIENTNRTKQNVAALQVAAGFLSTKAQRWLDSGITTVPIVPKFDIANVMEGLQVKSCFTTSATINRDIEYMHGIAGGQLESWTPKSDFTWSNMLAFGLISHSHLPCKLARLQDMIDLVTSNADHDQSLIEDLRMFRDLLIMCIVNDSQLVFR